MCPKRAEREGNLEQNYKVEEEGLTKKDSHKGLRIACQRIGTRSQGGAGYLKKEKSIHWLNAMKGQVRCKLQIFIGFIDDKRVINGLRQSFSGLMGTEST